MHTGAGGRGRGWGLAPPGHEAASGCPPPSSGVRRTTTLPGLEGGIRTGRSGPQEEAHAGLPHHPARRGASGQAVAAPPSRSVHRPWCHLAWRGASVQGRRLGRELSAHLCRGLKAQRGSEGAES